MGRKKIKIQKIKDEKLRQVFIPNPDNLHKEKARFTQKGNGTFFTL
jgi:hypothetical protein